MVITIDGPAASGKSTLAQKLAQKLGFYFVSSGYLYRALAYLVLESKNYTLNQLDSIQKTDINEFIDPQRLMYCYDVKTGISIIFDGEDITQKLKNQDIDAGASIIGTNKEVRHALTLFQRNLAQHHNLILEGRDSGSVVFPDADIKFYLTASPKIRAQRWQKDQKSRGNELSFEEALEMIVERDVRDSTREIAPLIIPKGAIGIDNSYLTQEQTFEVMLEYVQAALAPQVRKR